MYGLWDATTVVRPLETVSRHRAGGEAVMFPDAELFLLESV